MLDPRQIRAPLQAPRQPRATRGSNADVRGKRRGIGPGKHNFQTRNKLLLMLSVEAPALPLVLCILLPLLLVLLVCFVACYNLSKALQLPVPT